MKTEAVPLKESKRGVRETLEEGQGKCCNQFIISKDKRNNFKRFIRLQITEYKVPLILSSRDNMLFSSST